MTRPTFPYKTYVMLTLSSTGTSIKRLWDHMAISKPTQVYKEHSLYPTYI